MAQPYQKGIKRHLVRLISLFGIGVTSKFELTRLQKYPETLIEQVVSNLVIASHGVLHIGAHTGQEAAFYAWLNAKVLWIEANPAIYERLLLNIENYRDQRAICALIGTVQDEVVDFNVSSNDGLSASIFEFGTDSRFPEISMIETKKLVTKRLDALLKAEEVDSFRHWVLDVQGAELVVLQSAGKLLDRCFSLQVEVSTRDIYSGGARWEEINSFLNERGMIPLWHPKLESHENVIFIRHREVI